MNYAEAEKTLNSCGQGHVLSFWKKLSKKSQESLLAQIATIEPKNVKYCQGALSKGAEVPDSSKDPAQGEQLRRARRPRGSARACCTRI